MSNAASNPELQRILMQEEEKRMVNQVVSALTSQCWDKCITSTPGNKFSSGESACLTNCAHRFLDVTVLIMKRFQSMN
ncbi:Mitochondrial import inner membrane translocase subunit tim8 [Turnera subulata]|uniref:Mitochondrial import inner membrane translocase subunit n=1 Tax=Turnera subulata TaxID=218843 RepID=A0A9Q0JRI0_9ROSI|nr:Mitochondrial import inner membrane translocase subunit tim8 [Turnera subulata]